MNKMIYKKLVDRKNTLYCVDNIRRCVVYSDEIAKESIIIANYLYRQGIRKSDAVALFMKQDKGSHILSIYFANIWLGAISTPINSNYSHDQKVYALEKSEAKIIIVDESYDVQSERETVNINTILSGEEPEELQFDMPALFGNDTMAILFTAGTTGKSKGVCMSVNSMITNLSVYGKRLNFNQNTKLMLMSPLVHASTITHAIIIPVLFGSTIALNDIFNMQLCADFWKIVQKDEITDALSVPSMLGSLLLFKSRYRDNQNHFQSFICGSAVLIPSLKEETKNTFQIKVNEFYASTETAIIATTIPGISRDDWMPIEGTEVKLADDGEILVHSQSLFNGYVNDEEETKNALFTDEEGKKWYRTGDIGKITSDGFFKLTDRKKDLIIKGGYNISPSEVDLVFMKHDYVNEVATIGVPDTLYGEDVLTVVKLTDNVSKEQAILDLTDFYKKELEKTAWPQKILIVNELPKSSMGKIDKIALKKMVMEGECEF